ncbi:hypothetical protein TEA_017796 [Camellia sinensis var. sinensis]|uniref:Uncharacterized protein n=1 Tax=Camellia sinensis var. sinensis TaxID=542762 RepID=A0A4S4D8E6_CAMSN|nr:hypothetical protein TEA_017796 [Camellia sinensis var. sinensis]
MASRDIEAMQIEGKKIDDNDYDDKKDTDKEKILTQALPFHKLLSYADPLDWTLMALGTLGSIVHGMALPMGYLLLGKALDAFGNNIHDSKAMVKALHKVIPFVWYMAIATFPAGVLEIGCWMYTSERQIARLRLAFLRAALSQEIGAFDTDLTTGKIITGISNHMSIIQDAIGEKKRKKKTYTKPKKIKHKKKKVKLAVLQFYKVDDSGKVQRLRKECPNAECGAGTFMANHFDRHYCGKCGLTYVYQKAGEIGCWMHTSERQIARLRLAFLRAALSQEIGAFDTDLTTGKIITGISNHMSIMQDAIATYTKKMNAISATKTVHLSEATSMVEQTISQIKTVFAFVGESYAMKSFSKYMEEQFKLSKVEALIKGVGIGMFQTVTFCSWALIVWVGAVVVTAHRAKGGDVISAVMSILFGAISLTYAAPDMQIFNQAKAAGKEVFQVIKRKPLISYDSIGKTLEVVDGNIEIRDVYFAYPSRPEELILRGFTLSIPAGKVVAFVGSSGCGKSTVISLVARFYDPSKGEILVDNHNVKDLDLKFLRKNIGAVSQEPSLFAGTIKDNMKVGNKDADDRQIQSASEMANAHLNYLFHIPTPKSVLNRGQRGVQLSGGQKQRIAIARAILKDPPILLLDEATSALDSESEKLVQDALETAMQGRTVILIAHRMSTIINADMIVVVDNGQVQETGTHRELLDTSKFYNNLFNMQNINVDGDLRVTDPAEQPTDMQQQISSQNVTKEQPEELTELSRHHNDPPKQEEQKGRQKTAIFFRIWFSLTKKELVKTIIGSFAAALSGISKPIFGFFIITIGVAYYEKNTNKIVGRYSVIFALVGLLSLFSHILQHYVFGVVGEKAMTNFRQALYAGIPLIVIPSSFYSRPMKYRHYVGHGYDIT